MSGVPTVHGVVDTRSCTSCDQSSNARPPIAATAAALL